MKTNILKAPFRTAPKKKMKYLCINLRKQVQRLYAKNDKTLMKEIKDLYM